MAIVNNLWLRGTKKKLGGTVIYQSMGRTLQRELAPSVSNPRTTAQMQQRVKWSNLVNFYRANASWMSKAFETKKTSQTDYNKFMSLNVTNSAVALTKTEAANNACVIAPYKVTEGTLAQVEISSQDPIYITNLWLPSAFTIIATTTVGELSSALLGANNGLLSGDQLSFIYITQNINSTTSAPYIIVRKYEMILDTSSAKLVSDYLPTDIFKALGEPEENFMMVDTQGVACGFAIIISRNSGGKVLVSSSQITTSNNTATYNKYTSASQIAAAIDSYGETSTTFLSTAEAQQIEDYGTDLSILSVFDTMEHVAVGNYFTDTWNNQNGKLLTLSFSGLPSAAPTAVKLTYSSNTTEASQEVSATDMALMSSQVTCKVPEPSSTEYYGYYLTKIVATIAGVNYTAEFTMPSPLDE